MAAAVVEVGMAVVPDSTKSHKTWAVVVAVLDLLQAELLTVLQFQEPLKQQQQMTIRIVAEQALAETKMPRVQMVE
jgi:hypothetical protein